MLKTGARKSGGRALMGRLVYVLALLSVAISLLSLVVILGDALADGLPYLTWRFVTSFPSRFPTRAGILPALIGSVWLVLLTALFSFPLGVGAAIYLEEYAPKNRVTEFIQVNIANLAGVPSIVYGLLGLGLFVDALALGRSVLAGALTMTLLILPVIIMASREALRSVPKLYREGAFALGATRWEVTRQIVLPEALPGILTGTIISLSRAIGEAAPMIAIAALVYVTFVPLSPLDRFTVLPIQIYNWVNLPRAEFRNLAAAGIILLLAVLVAMNSVAIAIRYRHQRKAV
ncbi:phosphate ABC transporter, permease protein PstA [Candidatus Bathyarchaeota archaeon RBG_16_57_9]|nr:MAG: phosphate ABC transporter, permease protein PstA [Candidatus Bathyarchaeota archaeon RBG_16_57_9]